MTPQLLNKAQILTIYIGESDRWRGKPLYAAILELLKKEGIAGATVTRGVAGFGAHSRIHSAAILRLSEDLPLIIQVIDSPEHIARATELVSPMVREGIITLQDIQVIRYTHRYLNPLPADRLVEEVMTTEVNVLTEEMSIAEAWQKMLILLVKAMPVVDSEGKVVGMLTDEDLLERAGLQQRLSVAMNLEKPILAEELAYLQKSTLTVGQVMSKPPITVKVKDSLGLAASRMSQHGIKRLPVVDEHGKLVGVISRVDILRLVAEITPTKVKQPIKAGRTVEDIMSPKIPFVKRDDDLSVIIERMLENGLHRVIVVGDDGKAMGLISDSDVVARIQPTQRRKILSALLGKTRLQYSDITAADLMSPGVLAVYRETSLLEAAKQMMDQKRKWLVVIDEKGLPIGLVDRQILLAALSSG